MTSFKKFLSEQPSRDQGFGNSPDDDFIFVPSDYTKMFTMKDAAGNRIGVFMHETLTKIVVANDGETYCSCYANLQLTADLGEKSKKMLDLRSNNKIVQIESIEVKASERGTKIGRNLILALVLFGKGVLCGNFHSSYGENMWKDILSSSRKLGIGVYVVRDGNFVLDSAGVPVLAVDMDYNKIWFNGGSGTLLFAVKYDVSMLKGE